MYQEGGDSRLMFGRGTETMDTKKSTSKDVALSAIETLGEFCTGRKCEDCELASVFTEMDAVTLTFRQRPY